MVALEAAILFQEGWNCSGAGSTAEGSCHEKGMERELSHPTGVMLKAMVCQEVLGSWATVVLKSLQRGRKV